MPNVNVPDFNDMMELASDIRNLTVEKLRLDVEIKFREKSVVLECMNNEKYFKGGKAPSMDFVNSTYRHSGLEDELIPLRFRLAELTAEVESTKLKFDIMKMQVSLFQTMSANERISLG